VLGLLAATSLLTVTPSDAGAAQRATGLYWGAWIGSHLTGEEAPWDFRAVAVFERRVGKGMSLVHFSSPFSDCTVLPCRGLRFPAPAFTRVRRHGAIPFFSWNSGALPVVADQPGHRLADVIDGRHDRHITAWARAARRWRHPFFLRFDWEMNGGWFPWSEGVNGNTPGEFVAAWRHVHDIFRRVGATNVTWVWAPNIDWERELTPLPGLYPGDRYVDWTALDGYNRGGPWKSFRGLFASTYDEITRRIAPGKPMLVAETASTETGGDKARWIADLFAVLPRRFPAIRGLVWFEKDEQGMNWPLASSAAALEAFAGRRYPPGQAGARGVAARAFKGNVYRRLRGGKIGVP
jgi:hypothetical protein